MDWECQSPSKEVVGVRALDILVCMERHQWPAISRNLLTLGGAVPPESARPQMSEHQNKEHA